MQNKLLTNQAFFGMLAQHSRRPILTYNYLKLNTTKLLVFRIYLLFQPLASKKTYNTNNSAPWRDSRRPPGILNSPKIIELLVLLVLTICYIRLIRETYNFCVNNYRSTLVGQHEDHVKW